MRDLVTLDPEQRFVRRKTPTPGKVALISGGGAGHEPLHAGLVGRGMLDAACPGQIFTAPVPDQMLAAAQAVDQGAGVLFIVKNYEGDVMNFEMAAEMLEKPSATVLVDDDVAVETSTYSTGRRGVAGTLVVEKLVGAAAEQGRSLADLQALGQAVNRRTRSMGVALTSCIVPAAGKPNFDISDSEMEMGVGIHGEPGRRRVPLASAKDIVEEICAAILSDLAPARGAEALLFVNGFGATPSMELYLLFNEAVAAPRRRRRLGSAEPGRIVCDLDRHGRRVDHRVAARRGSQGFMGRAGAYGGASLGRVTRFIAPAPPSASPAAAILPRPPPSRLSPAAYSRLSVCTCSTLAGAASPVSSSASVARKASISPGSASSARWSL